MIPSELFHILFGLAIGCIWAVGERSLRKATAENYNRACVDVARYRERWSSLVQNLSNRIPKEAITDKKASPKRQQRKN